MIYNSFFGFSEEPFGVTPDPRFLYMSKKHEEAIAHITFGIKENRGFVLLTGEIGSGKTTLIRYLIGTLTEKAHTAVILNPMVSSLDLLKLIVHDFGIKEKGPTYKDLMEGLNNFLIDCFKTGEKAILVIDEAQEMSTECLEFVRLLSNIETDTHKLVQVILVGQPELRRIIGSEKLKQLDQRIAVRYHLAPLDENDTGRYIGHRIKVAGSDTLAFPVRGIKAIYKASRGIPRLINLYSDRALMLAYAEVTPIITSRIIKKTLKELREDKKPAVLSPLFVGLCLLLTLMLVFLVAVVKEKDLSGIFGLTEKIVPEEKALPEKTMPVANTPEPPALGQPSAVGPGISFIEGTYKTGDPGLSDEASMLNLLNTWGEKDLNTDISPADIENRGYRLYEFKDARKIAKLKLPVILRLSENNESLQAGTVSQPAERAVLLRWIAGKNALIIDPIEGKKILPFDELKDKIMGIKLLYKNKYNTGGGKKVGADPEAVILRSIDADTPKLVP